jgi:hypothetical protein
VPSEVAGEATTPLIACMVCSVQVRVGATDADSPVAGSRRRGPGFFPAGRAWVCGLCRRRPRATILDCATGQAKMGELVGVLGPSGAERPGALIIVLLSTAASPAASTVLLHRCMLAEIEAR